MHRKIISSAIVVLLAIVALSAQQWDRFNDQMQARFPLVFSPDNTYDIGSSAALRPRTIFVGTHVIAGGSLIGGDVAATNARITGGSATGLTINVAGQIIRQVYKATIDRTAFVCAALTCDVTIATLPIKTAVLSAYADLTQVFACAATCTSATLSMLLGTGAGDARFLASFDVDAAISLFGDADAEMGTVMTRAAAVQGGYMTSFVATTTTVVRLTSGTGNIGNGSATNLSTGSITFYIVTERLP